MFVTVSFAEKKKRVAKEDFKPFINTEGWKFNLVSALESGCSILYSEDMQHGQVIENTLKIINPFE